MKFSELHIHPDIIRACTDAGFETLTEIQEKCLIPATQGRDIAGISQTGTGKTVAFLLPLLDRIVKDNLPGPAALIITPTRELCLQIAEEALKLTKHGPVSVSAVYGGEGYRKQEEELAKNPQIIVATPGRLIDYIKQGKIDLNKLHFLVLDEADRMFDMGFIRDIGFIMKKVPREAQTMLFSATLSYYVMRLAADFMNDPVEVRIEAETVAVDKIDQQLFHLGKDEKMPYLINQVLAVPGIRAIVFTNLRVYVSTIVNNLRRYGVHATGLSSMLDQKKRVRLLKDFKLGKYSVLVATDVASRGLDVDDITHVFNYDLPQDAESYVHRIGRTARAGRSGISISYCSEMDYEALPRVESYLGKKIPVKTVDVELLKFPAGQFTPFQEAHGERVEGEDRSDRDSNRDGRGGGRNRGGRKRKGQDRPGFAPARGRDRNDQDPSRESGARAGVNSDRNQKDDRGKRDDRGRRDSRDRRDDRGRRDGHPGQDRGRNDRHGQGNRGRDGGRPGRGDGRHGSHRHRDRDRTRRESVPQKKPGIIARILSIFKKKKPEA